MNFFTDENYRKGIALTEYESYCETIWETIPIGIKKISKGMLPDNFDPVISYSLHDSRIYKLDIDEKDNCCYIYYLVYDESDIEYKLKAIYKGLTEVIKPSKDFIGNDRYCDIMCHEVFKNETGVFFHTILFSGGEELKIGFFEFELEVL